MQRNALFVALAAAAVALGCNGDGVTSDVGTFDGLFDDVATGLNFPLDIAILPHETGGTAEPGDIYIASYGTSEIMVARAPSGGAATTEPFYAGPTDGLRGAMAVSVPLGDVVWAAFEQGGTGGAGGVVVLSPTGATLAVLDGATSPEAFANPGGICWGGWNADSTRTWFFLVNLGDGTAWRISAADVDGTEPELVRVGSGLATGTLGNPSVPGSPLSSSSDTPEGGARGCAYADGSLYVADAQNARVVRFDGADEGVDIAGVPLENTPSDLVTFPTGLTINDAGDLIVISFDNAHAFVSLELPGGGFLDNGLHDLNVNSGNYGVAVAHDTIWFTRANNSNGALRAITPAQDVAPTTVGPFPAQ